MVLYPESQQNVIDRVTQEWSCAWILHDKDEGKKAHVHILCHFKNARYFSGIAKSLGIPEGAVNRVDSPDKAYQYLTHENAPEKHQYDKADLCTHDFELDDKTGGDSEEEQVEKLMTMPEGLSLRQAARWALDNGCWAAYRRGYAIWKDIRQEEAQRGTSQQRAARLASLEKAAQYTPDNVVNGHPFRLVAMEPGQPWTNQES